MTAGAMIAASIMLGRALAPIETAIANWRGFIARPPEHHPAVEGARRAPPRSGRLDGAAAPARSLDVENVTVVRAGQHEAGLSADIRFRLKRGPGARHHRSERRGQVRLARALVGIWRPAHGRVRLDGAALDQWDPGRLGQHIGYIPQDVELFDGTVSENIARLRRKPDAEPWSRGTAAGAHEMILRLPKGYDTRIGEGG